MPHLETTVTIRAKCYRCAGSGVVTPEEWLLVAREYSVTGNSDCIAKIMGQYGHKSPDEYPPKEVACGNCNGAGRCDVNVELWDFLDRAFRAMKIETEPDGTLYMRGVREGKNK